MPQSGQQKTIRGRPRRDRRGSASFRRYCSAHNRWIYFRHPQYRFCDNDEMLLDGGKLHQRLHQLLAETHSVDLAVAWITDCTATQTILTFAKQGKSVRLLAGIRDCLTSPGVLRSFHECASLQIGSAGAAHTFHPKLYIFHQASKRIVWIGSANLTEYAFHGNVEMVVEFEDQGEVVNWFETAWKTYAPPPDEEWLNEYEIKANIARKSQPRDVPQMEPPTGLLSSPLQSWSCYLRALRSRDRQSLRESNAQYRVFSGKNSYLTTIDAAKPLFNKDWSKLSESDAKILLGLKGDGGVDYGQLGSMSRALIAKNTLFTSNQRNLPRRKRIAEALREVIRSSDHGIITAVQRAYEVIDQFGGFGEGVTTRLLALARPDVLISVNNRSIERLSEFSGISTAKLRRSEGYRELVRRVMTTKWWKEPEPADPIELRIWQVRAAVIDGLAYQSE